MAVVQPTHSGKVIFLSSGSPPPPSWLTDPRDPGTGELDSDLRMDEDWAADEAFDCLGPFDREWNEMGLDLDDPH